MFSKSSPAAQWLLLICLFGGPSAYAAELWHFAVDGDTLWDLCELHTERRTCFLELQEYNAIDNDRRIPVDTLIRIPATWLKEPPVVGSVIALDGDTFHRDMSDAEYSTLQMDQPLVLGDGLRTEDGALMMSLVSGATMLLRPDSQVVLESLSFFEDYPLVEILLDYGVAEAAVDIPVEEIPEEPPGGFVEPLEHEREPELQIATAAADTSIQGSARISTEQGSDMMRGEVLTGMMDVSTGDTTASVPAGYGVSAAKGQPVGEPSQLLGAPAFTAGVRNNAAPVTVAWQADAQAVAWQLEVYRLSGTSALQSMQLDQPQHVLAGLLQGCYELTLRAIDAQGLQGMENRAPLCIVPPAPVIGEIAKSEIEKPGVNVPWSLSEGAVSYTLDYALDEEFSQFLGTRETGTTHLDIGIEDQDVVYVRVQAVNATGQVSEYSEVAEYKFEEFDWIGMLYAVFVTAVIVF